MQKPRYVYAAIFCASVLTLCACSGPNNDAAIATPSPTPDDPVTRTARLELQFQGGDLVGGSVTPHDLEGKMRTEARQAVTDFVKQNLQGWNIIGMSSQQYPGSVFSIDADLEKPDSHMVLTFEVRTFFTESGERY